jgi:hypothetical protein
LAEKRFAEQPVPTKADGACSRPEEQEFLPLRLGPAFCPKATTQSGPTQITRPRMPKKVEKGEEMIVIFLGFFQGFLRFPTVFGQKGS